VPLEESQRDYVGLSSLSRAFRGLGFGAWRMSPRPHSNRDETSFPPEGTRASRGGSYRGRRGARRPDEALVSHLIPKPGGDRLELFRAPGSGESYGGHAARRELAGRTRSSSGTGSDAIVHFEGMVKVTSHPRPSAGPRPGGHGDRRPFRLPADRLGADGGRHRDLPPRRRSREDVTREAAEPFVRALPELRLRPRSSATMTARRGGPRIPVGLLDPVLRSSVAIAASGRRRKEASGGRSAGPRSPYDGRGGAVFARGYFFQTSKLTFIFWASLYWSVFIFIPNRSCRRPSPCPGCASHRPPPKASRRRDRGRRRRTLTCSPWRPCSCR